MGLFYHSIFEIFPPSIMKSICKCLSEYEIIPEEIRLRVGQPVVIKSIGCEYLCPSTAVTKDDMSFIMMNASNGAFHASTNNLLNGYFPLPNGCRLGFCGEGSNQQAICNIRSISSMCLRIANESIGCADDLLNHCYSNGFQNTVIIGPPGTGKTTLLRECIRALSEKGHYIGVADERGEISGMHNGRPSFDLGKRTDIMFGINKQQAAMMLLRTMSPNILAMDEITAMKDMPAIIEAMGCGVGLLTTIHGKSSKDLDKPLFKPILDGHIFDIAIVIDLKNNMRDYKVVQLNA